MRLFPQDSISICARASLGCACAQRILHCFAQRLRVGQVFFDRIFDLTAQNDIAMALDDIFQPHFADRFDRVGQLIDVAIDDIGQGHKGITGKQDPVFFHQDRYAILRMPGRGQ